MLLHLSFLTGWFWHPLGSCTGDNCKGYQFWSGIGSDFGEITLISTAIAALVLSVKFYRRHLTCHVTTCNRPALYHVVGTPYRTCHEHHPVVPEVVTPEHIKRAHRNLNDR